MKALLLLAATLMLACAASISASRLAAAAAGSAEFARFVDDYFNAKFAYEPSTATADGFHEYDTKAEDLSRTRIEARVAELHALLKRLERFDRTRLEPDDAIDADVLEGQMRGDLLELETLRTWEKNPMTYAGLPGGSVDSLIKRSFAPPAERLRSVIARLRALPDIYEAARANVQNPPREFTDLAIRMARGSVGFFEQSVALWAADAAAGDAELAAEFAQANERMAAATRQFVTWLETDLLPRSQGSYAIGAANFLAKLRYDEMIEMPLEELLARGQAQLDKDHAAFVETARRIDATRTPAELMHSLSDEHPSEDDLIPSVRRSIEAARRFVVERGIATIPSEVRPRIEETPPYARSGSFASMDTPGPYETRATEAFYYVTPVEEDWDAEHREQHLRLFNPYVVTMINVHEAYPGHYLQFLYAPRFPTKTRKLVYSSSNAEGWAHYGEQMMVDEGLGGGNLKIRLAQLHEALLRDCRYVVGIKLHTQGMTVEEGARVFVQQGFQEPANAYEEARRGAYNPTYLVYTLGKLQILELRDEYRAAKGATLREFHDAFVAHGGLPIKLMRRVLLKS